MSLSRKIAAAVEGHRPEAGADRLVIVADGHRLELDVAAAGPVGVALHELRFRPEGVSTPPRSLETLIACGRDLSERLTYLHEPLKMVEADAGRGEVLLRSERPTARAGTRSYYEVLLAGDGGLSLRRWRFDEARRARAAVPCQLTIETLERLADDLTVAVC